MSEPIPIHSQTDTDYAEHTIKSLLEELLRTGRGEVAFEICNWLERQLTKSMDAMARDENE